MRIMNFLKIYCIGLLLVLETVSPLLARPWGEIVPLKSTRSDVEKLLLGQKGDSIRGTTIYHLKDKVIYVGYSVGKCGEADDADWNVEKDTVTGLSIEPIGRTLLLSLREDLTKFKKIPGAKDLPGTFIYMNPEDGFSISVDENPNGPTLVVALGYFPIGNKSSLKCPAVK